MDYTEGTEHGTAETAPAPEHPADGGREQMPTSKRTTKAPAFQFYPSDFMNSPHVRRMSMTERGVYISILCLDWMDHGVPTDLVQLAKDLHFPVKQLRGMWESGQIGQCFVERNGRYYNDRLIREREKQKSFFRRQSDNGSKGGRPKKNPDESHSKPTGLEIETHLKASALKTEDEDLSYLSVPEKIDVAFVSFREAYPQARRKGGFLVEQEFVGAVGKAGGPQPLMDALTNHKASEQWSDPKLIPGMDVWLREERWRQRLEPKGTTQANLAKVPAWAR